MAATNPSVAAPVAGRSAARPKSGILASPVRRLALGVLVILGALAFLAYQGLSNNLVYYITPSELLAKGPAAYGQQLRLGGQVKPGSQHWNAKTHVFRFVLQDPKGSVPVVSNSLPPPLFRSTVGAVVQGTYTRHRFNAKPASW